MKYVIDTSVLAKFYLEEEGRDKALDVLRQSILGKIDLAAPSLLYYEINGVFAKEGLSQEERNNHFHHLFGLVQSGVLKIVSSNQWLLEEAFDIASFKPKGLGHISVYDATFHAVALKEKAVFLTADNKYADKTEKQFGSCKICFE